MNKIFIRQRLYSVFFLAIACLILLPEYFQAQTPNFVWASKGEGQGTPGFFPYVRMTSDKAGNTYLVGSFYTSQLIFDNDTLNLSTSGYATLYVVKFDPDGKEIWAIQTEGFMYSMGNYITWNETTNKLYITGLGACKYNPNNSGNYLPADLGSHTFVGRPNGITFMAELDAQTGSVGWVKEFSFDIKFTTITAYGHNLYTGGTFNGSYYNYSTNSYVDSILSFGNGITLTNQSEYGNSSVFIAKYDDQGNAKWVTPHPVQCGGSNRQPTLTSITTDKTGQPIAFGNIESCIIFGNDSINYARHWMYTAKYDTSGNQLWHRENGAVPVPQGSGFNSAKEVVCDHNNDIVISGVYFYKLYWGNDTLTNSSGNYQAFLAKYDGNGNILWALDPGSAQFNNDYGGPGIAIDKANNIYLTMQYEITPVTLGGTTITPTIGTNGASRDILVAKFNPAGQPVWLKSAGGGLDEWGCDVVTDSSDNVYVSGYTASPNMRFDTHTVSSPTSYSLYVGKIGPTAQPNKAQFAANNTVICPNSIITFTDQSTGTPTGWKWTFTGGNPITSTAQNPTITYNTSGNFDVKLVVTFAGGSDSLTKVAYITVKPKPAAGTLSASDDTLCAGETSSLLLNGASPGVLQWQSSTNNVNFNNINVADSTYRTAPSQTTYYRAINTNNGCADTTAPLLIIVNPLPAAPIVILADSVICAADSTMVNSSGSFPFYRWNNGDTRSFTYATAAGGYWVTVTDANGCSVESNHVVVNAYPVPSVSIIVSGDTLSSFNAISYQWYFNNTLIPGATAPVYVAEFSGNYSVGIVDANGCEAVSSDVAVVKSSLDEVSLKEQFRIFPSPASESLTLKLIGVEPVQLESQLFNLIGEKLWEDSGLLRSGELRRVDISKFSKGIYLLQLQKGSEQSVMKVVIE